MPHRIANWQQVKSDIKRLETAALARKARLEENPTNSYLRMLYNHCIADIVRLTEALNQRKKARHAYSYKDYLLTVLQ